MICRTPEEAFQAGLAAKCEHQADPLLCPACRLTAAEVSQMAVLHRPYVTPASTPIAQAA